MTTTRSAATMSRVMPGPIEGFDTTTLRGRVYQHLREGILSNRIPPGTLLQEVPLAGSLGVSRGPIREALGDLAAEGLVTITPRRGAVVSSLSKREFLEAYQVREALESLAVQLAVPVMDETDFAELEATQARMIEAVARDDFLAFFDANIEFHDLWVVAADNRKLLDVYRRLIGQMVPYRRPSALLRGGLDRSIAEHRGILDAARERDATRASELMLGHIQVPQRRLQDLTEDEFAREMQGAMASMASSDTSTV